MFAHKKISFPILLGILTTAAATKKIVSHTFIGKDPLFCLHTLFLNENSPTYFIFICYARTHTRVRFLCRIYQVNFFFIFLETGMSGSSTKNLNLNIKNLKFLRFFGNFWKSSGFQKIFRFFKFPAKSSFPFKKFSKFSKFLERAKKFDQKVAPHKKSCWIPQLAMLSRFSLPSVGPVRKNFLLTKISYIYIQVRFIRISVFFFASIKTECEQIVWWKLEMT